MAVRTKTDSVDNGPLPNEAHPTSDDSLARRFAQGEPAAFDEVVETYHKTVARLANRLLAWSGDVEDVVQEVFLAAMKNASNFRRGSSLATWLTTITLNKCRSHRRSLMSRLRLLAGFGAQPSKEVASADFPAAQDEAFSKVRAGLRQLSASEREVIVLHYLEERSAAEMAALLGLRRGAVEVRLHRARVHLREILGVTGEAL